MELEVDGVNNRVAGRDYYQIQNTQGRFLTKDERKELNDRVQKLAENYGEAPWETWRSIHRAIGVEGVDQLRIEHRDQAQFMLTLLEERCRLKYELEHCIVPTEPGEIKHESMTMIRLISTYPRYSSAILLLGLLVGAFML